jgi:hypothetical protein
MNPYYRHFLLLRQLFFAIALEIFERRGGQPNIEEFKHRRRVVLWKATPHGEKQQRRTSNTGNPIIPEPALL